MTPTVTISRELAKFLIGESDIDGVWFGERLPSIPSKYWWRKELRAALNAEPKRPQNCGTGYCSCIECVMEPSLEELLDNDVCGAGVVMSDEFFAQPEPAGELPPLPVGDRFKDESKFRFIGTGGGHSLYECWDTAIQDYARAAIAQSKQVPLTDEQINDAYGSESYDHIPHDDVVRISRAIEAAHGIGAAPQAAQPGGDK